MSAFILLPFPVTESLSEYRASSEKNIFILKVKFYRGGPGNKLTE